MNSSSANRLVAVILFFTTVVVFAFAFFTLTGGFRKIGLPGSSYHYDDDATFRVESKPEPLAPPKPLVRRAPVPRDEPFRPVTEAEKAVRTAHRKLEDKETLMAIRRHERQLLKDFLSSDVGEQFVTAQKLAEQGQFDDAKSLMNSILQQMDALDIRIRLQLVKSAIFIYQRSKDRSGLQEILATYLELIEEDLSNPHMDKRTKASANELLDEVQERMSEVRSTGGGSR